MTDEEMWNDEDPVINHGIDVPAWIEQDISPSEIMAICQGGCDSGAYMPAVTYYNARKTMGEHGDDVLNFLQEHVGDVPALDLGSDSWAGYNCKILSMAVELWAVSTQHRLSENQ